MSHLARFVARLECHFVPSGVNDSPSVDRPCRGEDAPASPSIVAAHGIRWAFAWIRPKRAGCPRSGPAALSSRTPSVGGPDLVLALLARFWKEESRLICHRFGFRRGGCFPSSLLSRRQAPDCRPANAGDNQTSETMKRNAFLLAAGSLVCAALTASATTRYVNRSPPPPERPTGYRLPTLRVGDAPQPVGVDRR